MNILNGERKSRSELVGIIEDQSERLKKYETRLRDLVRAYKGLGKEKEALEESLKALEWGKNGKREDSEGGGEIATLTSSLSTVMAEKNRLESSFQEDKKKCKAELDEARSEVKRLRGELKEKEKVYEMKAEELKSSLIVEKHEREKDMSDHASVLKELQRRLVEERVQKDKLQNELDASDTPDKAEEEYKIKIRELEAKLSEERARKRPVKSVPTGEINRLRQEMSETENFHRRELAKAELRAQEAENRSAETRKQHESRVTNLELRLGELSDSVVSYDRLRQQDQLSIVSLRERVAQLDSENNALANVRQNQDVYNNEDEVEDVHVIMEKIIRLKSQLRESNEKSLNPILDIDEYFTEEKQDNSVDEEWKTKYNKLKEDFEALKKERSSVKENFSLKKIMDGIDGDREELIYLRSQLQDSKERINRLRYQLSSSEGVKNQYESDIRELKSEINQIKISLVEQNKTNEDVARKKMLLLEGELEKQRSRFLASMCEKDEELKNVKDNLELAIENGFVNYMARKTSGNLGSTDMDKLTEKLNVGSEEEDKMILHYVEESARKEAEITQYRSKIRDLESALRELQARFLAKEEDYVTEIEGLNDKIVVLNRLSKSDFNVEYLKNVVLNYMLSSDKASREHMLKAIGAVLVFSQKEIKRVTDFNRSWLWKSA